MAGMLRHFTDSSDHPRDRRIEPSLRPLPPREVGEPQRFGPGGFDAVILAAFGRDAAR